MNLLISMDGSSGDDELERNDQTQRDDTIDEVDEPIAKPAQSEYADYKRLLRQPEQVDGDELDVALTSVFGAVSELAKSRLRGALIVIRKTYPLLAPGLREASTAEDRTEPAQTAQTLRSASDVDGALAAVAALRDRAPAMRRFKLGKVNWAAYDRAAANKPAFKGEAKVQFAMARLGTALPRPLSDGRVSNNVFQHRLAVLEAAKREAQELDASIDLLQPVKVPRKERSDKNKKRKRRDPAEKESSCPT